MGGASAENGWWSPERDRWTFCGFFVLGVVFILVLKTAVGNQIVAAAVPCLFMLWYAVLQWDFRGWEPKPGANGDNLYYLGFLYTLTSLGHALYRFSTDQEDTEVIVTNFGIAIFTTILGMALRILLGRPEFGEPHEIEASARRDLASVARELRAELGYSAGEFNKFRAELAQDFKVFRERLAEEADLAQGVAATMRKAVETIVDRTRELERSAAALTAFEDTVGRLNTGTAGAVEAIGEHSTVLAAGPVEIGESLRSQADRMRAVNDACAKSLIEDAERRAKELAAGADTVRESLRLQAERIGTLDFPRAFSAAVKPASADLRAAAVEFRTLLHGLRQADEARGKAAGGYERALAALNDVLREQKTLASAVAAAASESRATAESLGAAGDRLAGFNAGAADAARQVAGVRDQLAGAAERLKEVNEELGRTFAELARRAAEERENSGRRRWWPFARGR